MAKRYLYRAAYSKCNKRLEGKNNLLENKKATLTLLNTKNLPYVYEYHRTRQDAPCGCCAYFTCYINLSAKNTQGKSNDNGYAQRSFLRKRSQFLMFLLPLILQRKTNLYFY